MRAKCKGLKEEPRVQREADIDYENRGWVWSQEAWKGVDAKAMTTPQTTGETTRESHPVCLELHITLGVRVGRQVKGLGRERGLVHFLILILIHPLLPAIFLITSVYVTFPLVLMHSL